MQRKNDWKLVLSMVIVAIEITTLIAWITDTAVLGQVRIRLPELGGLVAIGAMVLVWANWPSFRRLSNSARFRDLHLLIDNEYRSTRSERRTTTTIGADRAALRIRFEEFGIYPPSSHDHEGWLRFLQLMSALSEKGNIRRARFEYGDPELAVNWEDQQRRAGQPRGQINESSAEAHLESCRARVLSQDTLSREYATKAAGIATFGASILVFGVSWEHSRSWTDWELAFVINLVILVIWIAILAFYLIIRPTKWREPCNLAKIEGDIWWSKPDWDYATFLMKLAHAYLEAIEFNKDTLKTKASRLTLATRLVVVELVVFAIFKFFL